MFLNDYFSIFADIVSATDMRLFRVLCPLKEALAQKYERPH
jgi:hypothetical protein